MFKKPFKVKSNSQLKGSDRKKVRNGILNNFPSVTEDDLNLIIPNKETMFAIKVITHSDQIVTLYCVQKLPIIFEIDTIMYPTVYMLWHLPDLLYAFTTHPQVFPIIAGGADLMLPGIVLENGPSLHAYGKMEKGTRVSINLTSNRAPIAVGKTALSSYDMYMSGKFGKCVQVLHYYGDQLSSFGQKLVLPELGPVFLPHSDSVGEESIDSKIIKDSIEINLPISLDKTILSGEKSNAEQLTSEEGNLGDDILENENNIGKDQHPEEEMDELILCCFLKALKTTVKKVDLPLLTSNFYKLHMIPACPPTKSVDLKKSSFKKLSKFLDEMEQLEIIKTQMISKGVLGISEINFGHALLVQFIDPWVNIEDPTKPVVDMSSGKPVPEIVEKFTVTAAVLPLFEKYAYKKKDALSPTTVRKALTDYIKTQQLQDHRNKKYVEAGAGDTVEQSLLRYVDYIFPRYNQHIYEDIINISKDVKLDELLRSVIGEPNETLSLTWDQLIAKLFSRMGQAYKVELGTTESLLNKGKLQPINISVGTRSGNKKVTLVDNIELYGISLQDFSKECQHGVAASTTINTLPNMKSAQVQIQGNQVQFVGKLLMEKYSIPKKYLRGLENAPKKKK